MQYWFIRDTSLLAVPFEKYIPSKSPIYSNPESWAVKPDKYSESLKKIIGDSKNKNCDIFFIYPTMFLDRKDTRWNADVNDELLNKDIINKAIKYQASAFGKAGNIYVPFYRQSHYKVYVNPFNKYEEESREIAYSDIKRAFEYYLDNYNNGKPIILASHSQGSILSAMLLKEFFDNKPLQKKLVAAYLPGTKILDDYFKKMVMVSAEKSACKRLQVGCILVDDNHRILAHGYNGFLPKCPHESIVRDNHEQATVHAEQNAICDCARRGANCSGAIAYITHYPCIICTRLLLAAGIKEIKYLEDYKNDELVKVFVKQLNVPVLKIK